MISYRYTILYVDNVEESILFYKNVFEFKIRFITEEKDYAELSTGETSIAFASIALASKNLSKGFNKSSTEKSPFGIELGFTTTEVVGLFTKAVKHGATPEEEPLQKPWGQTVSYIRDLNGFLIEICSPIAN